MASPQIIQFDYDFSPYGQKTRLALVATSTPFKVVDVPMLIPRPTLEALGVTYRRIPVIAIGKDLYADSSLILSVINSIAPSPLPTSSSDAAYEALGNSFFSSGITVIKPELITPEFAKDRETVFPVFKRPDLKDLRPTGLVEWRSIFAMLETDMLAKGPGPFINGAAKMSAQDLHVAWVVRWVLTTLLQGDEGFGKEELPRVHRWLDALPTADVSRMDSQEAIDSVKNSEYFAKDIGVDPSDALGLRKGDKVNVESLDAWPGTHPQHGKVAGLDQKEIVIEVEGGVRLHFPRRGYVVRKI